MITSVVNEDGAPVEIAPGRGNLRTSSVPWVTELRRYLQLVDRTVSFSRIYSQQPMIAAAGSWLIRQARRVPLYTYRQVEDDSSMKLTPKQHPLAAAIANPWPGGSQVDLITQLLGSDIVHGNVVCPIDSGAKNKILFTPADWRHVIPIMPWRRDIVGWEIDVDMPDAKRVLAPEHVLYVREWSPLGPIGLSPLEQLGVTIAIEDAAHRHQRSMLANGVRTASAVKTTDERFFGLEPEERKQLMDQFRDDISDIMAGPENAGRPWLLPPGLDVTPIGQTAVEAQLIEQRAVNKTEAIAIYGITPATQGIIVRAAEIPEQRQMAVVEGLAPRLILIESCINAQIATGMLGEQDVYVQFDFTGILRGDKLAEIEALRNAISSALMTPNEGRDQLQLSRSNQAGMDEHWLPRNNLWPLGEPYQPNGNGAAESTPPGEASPAGTSESEGD